VCSAAPAARLVMSRRVHLLISLNPYQGNWVIKVRVTSKGNLRTYRNARGEGCVFNVELTDEDVSDNFLLGVLSALAVLVSG
jgi:replication factor A1